MDTVTQFVTGAAAGQLVGGRALGRTATLVGGLVNLWREVAGRDLRHVPIAAVERRPGAL